MIAVPNLPQALEKGLRAQQDDWGDDKLHVSDLAVAIGEKCALQLWLRLSGAKQRELTPGQMLMFRHGQRIHKDLVDLIGEGLPAGWEIQAVEKQVQLGEITGRYDTRLFHETGVEIIVDWKTMRGRAFGWLKEAKPAHVLQVQSYVTAADADAGLIFYVDREGQNAARQFYVQRDDERVWWAVEQARAVRDGDIPDVLDAKLQIKQNKGPDSVYLKQPWQCEYCEFLNVSCQGALPYNCRELGIVGKVSEDRFTPSAGIPEGVEGLVRDLLDAEKVPF